ncbi:MAG TPA: hypothetical protein VN645_07170 [Steroidobacteraceae bacterium]|nr:hypothetical protein [Steroidobacteraceae bacterium]
MAVLNTGILRAQIAGELAGPVPAAVQQLAQTLADRARGGAAAVLYYGSTLRTNALDGMLDFYVLLDRTSAWPGRVAALANWLLPPNVGYIEGNFAGVMLRAKYALITLRQFEKRVAGETLDTTLWARFCQPCRLVWQRSDADARRVNTAIEQAVITAAGWSAMLGPEKAAPADFWRALFERTYVTELRVESGDRSQGIVAADADRYALLLAPAWQAGGVAFETLPDGQLRATAPQTERARQQRRWSRLQRWGKRLNILRLLKAAFTFDGAMDYVAWKIERHRGVRIEVAPWQRRFPLLAAPGLYWKLRRRGILR